MPAPDKDILERSVTGQLPALYCQVGPWRDGETFLDIVAADAVDQKDILFGTCLFREKPAGTDVLTDLMDKAKRVPWGDKDRREVYAVCSISGFTPDLLAIAGERNDVLLLS